MKIPDKLPENGATPAETPARRRNYAWDPRLEEMDFRFFDVLGQAGLNGSRRMLTGQVAVSAPAPAPAKKAEPERESEIQKKVTSAKVEVAKLYDEISRVRVNRELEMLQGELTIQDVRFLEQFLVSGLPGGIFYQGGMPLQQMLPLNHQGGLDLERLPASKGLGELLEKAYKQGRSLRIDLDPRSSVILKFHQGRVSAEFLTQDQGMALYLKQYMDDLRQRLESKSLPVGTLTYRDEDKNQEQPRQHRTDDEPAGSNA
jgi:hypothetical protein